MRASTLVHVALLCVALCAGQALAKDVVVPSSSNDVINSSNIAAVFASLDAAKPTPAAAPVTTEATKTLTAEIVAAPADAPDQNELHAEIVATPADDSSAYVEPEMADASAESAESVENGGWVEAEEADPLAEQPAEPTTLEASIMPSEDQPAASVVENPTSEENEIVRVIDFGAEPTFTPMTEEMPEDVRERIAASLKGFLSDFFGGVGDLNEAPSSSNNVRTQTTESPDGAFRFTVTTFGPEDMQLPQDASQNGYSDPMPMPEESSFDDMPPMPPSPGFFHRFFGGGHPFGDHHGAKRGCKRHGPSGVFARLRSMLEDRFNSDMPPPPPFGESDDFAPPPFVRQNGFFFHHGPQHADEDFHGPFVRARFGMHFGGDEDAESRPDGVPTPDSMMELPPPPPEMVDDGTAMPEWDGEMPPPQRQQQEAGDVMPTPLDERAFNEHQRPLDEPQPYAGGHHRRNKHWVMYVVIAACVLALAVFAVFMVVRRRRLKRAAEQQSSVVMTAAPTMIVDVQAYRALPDM